MSARLVALQPGMRQMVMGSALLFVIFLVAWQWAPGLFGIPAFIIPPASLVWDQAENRRHAQKALLAWLLEHPGTDPGAHPGAHPGARP